VPTRRSFIWAGAAIAGGLAIGLTLPAARRVYGTYRYASPVGTGEEPTLIEIRPDNSIVVFSSLTEMGQGIATTLAQIVGEELDAKWEQLSVRMAPAWRAYSAPNGFFTGGSTSSQRLYKNMRTVAATARQMLVNAAAESWNVSPAECTTQEGIVQHAQSQRSASYGELSAAAIRQPPPTSPTLKPRQSWRLLGHSHGNLYAPAIATGSARYGIDISVPEMVVAAVSQAPVEGAVCAGLDRDAVLALPGVLRIVELSDTVAVIAKTFWPAYQGLKRANIRWQLPGGAPVATDSLRRQLLTATSQAAHAETGKTIVATYEAPLLLQAQMEPLNATARVSKLGAEIWSPTQVQEAMQSQVATALGLWTHAVTIHTPHVGGGFGRRLRADYGVAAARIAREVGQPVKAIWPREEDSTQGRFRTQCAARLTATLKEDGRLQRFDAAIAAIGDYKRVDGIENLPYLTTTKDVRYTGIASSIRIGSWRSVDASQNVFFRESFIDECALAAGIDPFEYRRMSLGDARSLRVMDALAEQCRWTQAKTAGRFLGLAFHDGFGSKCAMAVEIDRPAPDAWRVKQIWAVVDCGIALNPNGIRAQIEGGILFGLSAALFEHMDFVDGKPQQTNFDGYRLLRIDAAPPIQVEILESQDADIGGIGEVGVPPIAPAVTNALFAATGKRIRRLPLVLSEPRGPLLALPT
jgi:isoquinoline 1-oxidoreductase beta subunit